MKNIVSKLWRWNNGGTETQTKHVFSETTLREKGSPIGEQPTNSTDDRGIGSVMPADLLRYSGFRVPSWGKWSLNLEPSTLNRSDRSRGIQVRRDASGDIHVNLGSGTPCRNDDIEKYSPRFTILGALLLLSSGLMLIAPLTAFAQVRPDTYVYIGPIVKETHLTKGTVEKIVVTIGNLSPVPPPPDVHYTALLRVFTPADQLVCSSSAYFGSLPPSALQVLQFQVAHPSPITQLGPSQTAQPKGSTKDAPLAEIGRVPNHVQYRILVNLIPTKPCPQVDSNCNNNQLNPTLQFTAGGTPSCIKLQ